MNSAPSNPAANRAIGCLLGLAVGDAVGTTLEFSARDIGEPLTDMVGGGPFDLEPGQWTDDTSMALCLADSLIACGDLDQRDLMTRFVGWFRNGENSATGSCFDIGMATQTALLRFEDSGDPAAGSTDPNTAGNGSIMRLAPIALRWFRNREKAIAAAREQSITTHAAPESVEGCALLADYLVDAIHTGDPTVFDRPRSNPVATIDAIGQGGWRGKPRDEIHSSGYVVHTLEAALWAVERSGSFEQAILTAANLGDDADTVAAVAGQIAGALWGRSGIPSQWLHRLAWRDHIERQGKMLINAGLA